MHSVTECFYTTYHWQNYKASSAYHSIIIIIIIISSSSSSSTRVCW